MARLIAPFDSLPTVGKPSHAQHTAQPRQNPPAPKVPTDVQEWLNEHLKQIPKTLHRHARTRFLKTAEQAQKGWGWYHAKNELTDTIERMTAKAPLVATEVGIDAQDERIKYYADFYAKACTYKIKHGTGDYRTLHDAHVLLWYEQQERVINDDTRKHETHYIHTLNYAQSQLGHSIKGDTGESQIARIQDPAYWRREIRKALRPWRELWHLALAPHYLKYASAEAVAEYRSMQENGRIWAETHEMTTSDGHTCPLPSPAETAKNRHAQLVATTKGMENLAGETGMTAEIITITLDTQFHARTTQGGQSRPNQSYNSALTPDTGHDELNRRWARLRSALKRRKIEIFWVLGAQPNADETPHWHIVLWSHDEHKQEIKTLIYKYFKTNDNPNQINIQQAKSEAGASSYAMRMLAYITRQTDTIHGHTDADAHEAEAASAWASTWNIRRYRTSHTGATLWKMARHQEIKAPDDLKKAAQDGDFATFYKLKQQYACKILYVEKTGKYGDSYKSPRGIEYIHNDTGEISASWKQTSWTLSVKLEKEQQNQEAYSYFKEPRRDASAPQDTGFTPNTDPPEHWTEPEKAEWAEFLEYRITQQVAKLAKTA